MTVITALIRIRTDRFGVKVRLTRRNKERNRNIKQKISVQDLNQVLPPQVLTWLLSAEDGLQAQPSISNHVEEVKEQFHTHEVGAPLKI